MWYDAWRAEGSPTQYNAVHTPVTQDVLLMGIVFAFGCVLVPALVILPGFRHMQRWCYLTRVVLGTFVLSATVLCNFGAGWEVGTLDTSVPYRPGSGHVINATVGVNIGLRSINITLKASPETQSIEDHNSVERINYNERFSWNGQGWSVGNEGLAEHDGQLRQEILKAKENGIPWAILRIAEYLTLDGGGFRWGRHYQQAGFFTHCFLWLAFVTWLLTLLSLYMIKVYGAYMSLITGCLLLSANLAFAFIRNPTPLAVPFERGRLHLHWGWCFWLCLAAGVVAVAIGVLVIALDLSCPNRLNTVLNIDPGMDKECVEEIEGEDADDVVFHDLDTEADALIPPHPRCTSMGPGTPVTPFPPGHGYPSKPSPGAGLYIPASRGPATPGFSPLAPGFHPLGNRNSRTSRNMSNSGSGPLSPISETGNTGLSDPFLSQSSLPKTPKVRHVIVRRKASRLLRATKKKSLPSGLSFDRSTSCPAEVDDKFRVQTDTYGDVIDAIKRRHVSDGKGEIEMTAV